MPQNNNQQTFQQLKELLKPYEKDFQKVSDSSEKYELATKNSIEVNGRKIDKLFFVSLIIQGNYVGFYFMPVYIDSSFKDKIDSSMLVLLKGKSCFHIKEVNPALADSLSNALKAGFDYYKEKGWL